MPRILIADDNESLRTALKDILFTQQGWSICGEATNGASIVSMAAELKPDLIIMDFLMPLMNGLAAAAAIIKATPEVPIVLYTMHMSGQLEREAKKVGIRRVVSKTEPFDAFVAVLKEMLGSPARPLGPLGVTVDYPATISPSADPIIDPESKPPQKP
jgi:DNA-binding NarL/FixJ family response regulator